MKKTRFLLYSAITNVFIYGCNENNDKVLDLEKYKKQIVQLGNEKEDLCDQVDYLLLKLRELKRKLTDAQQIFDNKISEFQSAEKRLQQKNNELKTAKDDITQKEETIRILNEDVIRLHGEISQKQTDLDAVKKGKNEALKKITNLEEKLQKKCDELILSNQMVKNLGINLKNETENKLAAEQRIKILETEIIKIRAIVTEKDAEIVKLINKLTSAEKDKATALDLVNTKEAKLAETNEKLRQATETVIQKDAEIEKLKKELQSATDDKNKSINDLQQVQIELKTVKVDKAKVEQKVKTLKQDLVDAEAISKQKEEELQKEKEAKKILEQQVAKLQADLKKIEQNKAEIEKERDEKQMLLNNAEAEIKQKEITITYLKKELNDLEEHVDVITKEYKEFYDELEKDYNDLNNVWREAYNELYNDFKKVDNDHNETLKKLLQTNKVLHDTILDANNRKRTLEQAKIAAEKERDENKAKLNESKKEIEHKNIEIEKLITELEKAKQSATNWQTNAITLDATLQQMIDEKEEMQKNLDTTSKNVSDLMTQVEDLKLELQKEKSEAFLIKEDLEKKLEKEHKTLETIIKEREALYTTIREKEKQGDELLRAIEEERKTKDINNDLLNKIGKLKDEIDKIQKILLAKEQEREKIEASLTATTFSLNSVCKYVMSPNITWQDDPLLNCDDDILKCDFQNFEQSSANDTLAKLILDQMDVKIKGKKSYILYKNRKFRFNDPKFERLLNVFIEMKSLCNTVPKIELDKTSMELIFSKNILETLNTKLGKAFSYTVHEEDLTNFSNDSYFVWSHIFSLWESDHSSVKWENNNIPNNISYLSSSSSEKGTFYSFIYKGKKGNTKFLECNDDEEKRNFYEIFQSIKAK